MTIPTIVANTTAAPGGTGPVYVLGPSLGSTTRVWDAARPALAAEHATVAWDLPGHGRSPATAEGFTMRELAEGVLRALDAAGVERFVAAGISLGGVVSLQLALDHPERVAAVALVCSLPRIGTDEGWRERVAQVRASGTPSLASASAGRWFTPAFLETSPGVVARSLSDLTEVDDESYALCTEALRGTDLRERLGELAMPLRLIVGAEDPVIPIQDAQAVVDAAPRGALTVIEHARHLAPLEQPAAVVAALRGSDA